MKSKLLSFVLLAVLASGCATQQLRFDHWKGLPAEGLQDLKQGIFSIPKDKLFDAAAATLDHEPYFHWSFSSLDKTNGIIVGSAGLFREVQLRVVEQSEGKSRLTVSVPRRVLKTQAKIYVLKTEPSKHTAYEPAENELGKYTVLAADTEIDPAYFYSFTYRVLNDRTQVPFTLRAYQDTETQGLPPAQATSPQALPATNRATEAEPILEDATEKKPATADQKLPPAHRE